MEAEQPWHNLPSKLRSALILARKVGECSATRKMYGDFEGKLPEVSDKHLEQLAKTERIAEDGMFELERQVLGGIVAVAATVDAKKKEGESATSNPRCERGSDPATCGALFEHAIAERDKLKIENERLQHAIDVLEER